MMPTVVPQVIDTECDEVLTVSFDAYLSGGQADCFSVSAYEAFTVLKIDMTYGGASASSEEWASDMLFTAYDYSGHCVQVGGFDDYAQVRAIHYHSHFSPLLFSPPLFPIFVFVVNPWTSL